MARKVFDSPKKRAVVALLLAGAVIGAMFVSNAGAHVTSNLAHLRRHIAATKYLRSDPVTITNGNVGFATVLCPPGWRPTGGGVYSDNINVDVETTYPSTGNGTLAGRKGWTAHVQNNSGGDAMIRAYVICIRTPKTTGNYGNGALPIAPDALERPTG